MGYDFGRLEILGVVSFREESCRLGILRLSQTKFTCSCYRLSRVLLILRTTASLTNELACNPEAPAASFHILTFSLEVGTCNGSEHDVDEFSLQVQVEKTAWVVHIYILSLVCVAQFMRVHEVAVFC